MKLKNFAELATSEARKAALMVAEAALNAIDTEHAVSSAVRLSGDALQFGGESISLAGAHRILVVSVGKCATESAASLSKILGSKISSGIILDVKTGATLPNFEHLLGTHPVPSAANIEATGKILRFLKGLTADDLVIFAVSGGGSTLLCQPEKGSLEEEAEIFKALTRSGAAIQEINTIRKHLSLARGGHLAAAAYPAAVASLIFSDVPGNDMEYVASGPTIKDTTSIRDAENIISKYGLKGLCRSENCGLVETPKDGKYFEKVRNVLAVSNTSGLNAMRTKAAELGYAAKITDSAVVGEAREVGLAIARSLHDAAPGTALLCGGETTVTLRGSGKGGRNMELALAALSEIRDDELILSLASDGRDNQTEFAGALCDTMLKKAAEAAGISSAEYLARNDSYEFFKKISGALVTGDTGSNVSDLIIGIKTK